MLLPLDTALGQGGNATRVLPATVERGETFEVTITFTAPADQFNSISLRDTAPDGWNATVDVTWCTPYADNCLAVGARASLTWIGPYSAGTNFTVMHKVTVPCDASLGNNSFNVSEYQNFLCYHIGVGETIRENITGDCEVEVIAPALLLSAASINFYAAINGTNPQNRTLQLWSSSPCRLNWSLSDDADYLGHDWLSESPTSGNCTDEPGSSVNLSVNMSGLPPGTYDANITIVAPEARNSLQIIPVEFHIRETGTLEGHVSFPGRDAAPCSTWIEPFVVKLFQPGDLSQTIWTGNATTNDTGVFTITDVVVGTYDVGIKNATCLSEVVAGVTLTAGNTTVADFGYTREGDVDNDDWIYLGDLSALCTAWDTQPGNGNWNVWADLDRDGWVYLGDLSLFCANWDQKGDAYGHF